MLSSQVALVVRKLPVIAGDVGDVGSIPRSGISPKGGHGEPLPFSCLENPMDRGNWQTTVHEVRRVRHNFATKPQPPPGMCIYQFPRALKIHFHTLGGLKQQKFILTVLKAKSLKSQCWYVHAFSEGAREELFFVFQVLMARSHPLCCLACSCTTSVSACYSTRPSLCLCLPCSVLLRTLSLDVGSTLIQDRLSQLLIIFKDPVSK